MLSPVVAPYGATGGGLVEAVRTPPERERMFKDDPAKRLAKGEERVRKAEAVCDGLSDHLTAVGVTVPTETPVFFGFQGTPSLAVDLLDQALDIPEHGDASELLTNMLVVGAEWWESGCMVAGRLPRADSALLADPTTRTVTLYRPEESGDKPLGVWSFEDWQAEARPSWGPEAGTVEEQERAYAKGEAFVDLMQPGHVAAYLELRAAETEVIAAGQAVKEARRPALNLMADG